MTVIALDLPARLRAVMALKPGAPQLQFEGRWYPWAFFGGVRAGLDAVLRDAGLAAGTRVGVVLRNRPGSAAAAVAVLATGRTLVTMSPFLPDVAFAADITGQRTPVVIAEAEDWDRPGLREAVAATGCAGLLISTGAEPALRPVVPGRPDGGRFHPSPPDVAVEMLTSGTTGLPKRVMLRYANLEAAVDGAARFAFAADREVRLRAGIALATNPLVHISGLWTVLQSMAEGRRIALLERFAVDPWLELVREHRPAVVVLPPTAVRMTLDAGVDPDALSSVRAVISGSAPLSPELAEAFEATYGVPVLPVYGATEFTGPVAGWTLEDHRRYRTAKRGSVGRAYPGFELRVVGGDDRPIPAGVEGLLAVRGAQVGAAERPDGWVRTTDRAWMDEDGFIWIVGRADDVIIRGGFKVDPGEVRTVLEEHPAVREAAVVALNDARLGQVPAAAVIVDAVPVTEEELIHWVRGRLEPYKAPTRILFVDDFPRTPSMKVSQPAVRALLESGSANSVTI